MLNTFNMEVSNIPEENRELTCPKQKHTTKNQRYSSGYKTRMQDIAVL
jgi:hypothetical protein